MPLTKKNMTIASRVMLPIYPAFALGAGVSFVATPLDRLLNSPTLQFANKLIPLSLWGYGYLAVALVLLGALLARDRRAYRLALAVMLVWMAFYTAVTLWAAFAGGASFSAWTWPAFIVAACWATELSLAARET